MTPAHLRQCIIELAEEDVFMIDEVTKQTRAVIDAFNFLYSGLTITKEDYTP